MKFGIRYKFGVGLLIIFCISFNLLSIFINKLVISNNKEVLKSELLALQRDSNIYFNQFIIMNDIEGSKEGFEKNYNKYATALSNKINGRIVLYKSNGEFIYDTEETYEDYLRIANANIEQLEFAMDGKATYEVISNDSKYISVFYAPLYVNDDIVGIFKYEKDCSELYSNSNNIVEKIKMVTVIMFIVIFIFCFILSTRIVKPIIKLNDYTKEIINGNFNTDIILNTDDEIGELGRDFNIMKEKINEQIETIKRDRDDLITLENHRKVFFDNVTHEIKTPLTIIKGYAEMILDEEGKIPDISVKAASKIKIQSDKLNNMVVDILNISKLESEIKNDFKDEINIGHVISKICDELNVKAQKYEMIIQKNLEEDIYCYANKDDISSMAINIIDNSIKYSGANSVIKVKLYKENDEVIFSVQDSGKGINNEDLEKIFEPFYRGKDKFKIKKQGNGLGLSIVKSIVEKYNGKIEISSELNKGTKVVIKLSRIYNLVTS